MARISDGISNSGALAVAPGSATASVQAQPPSAPPHDTSRISILLLAGILVVAAILDLLFLGTRSLWLDESISVTLARHDWRAMARAFWSGEANMALYYGLLHEWLRLGESEFTIRALSVLMALGSVGAMFVLGKRMFDTRVALLGALLLAVNSYQIRYAQEARSYSLVTLLVILASLAFLQAMTRPTRRNWTIYTLTSVLAVYAHFFAVFVLVAHWSSAVLLGRRHIAQKGLVGSVAGIGLLLSPLAVFAATTEANNVGWIPKTSLRAVHHLFCALTGGAPWGGCPGRGSTLLLVLYAMACSLALVATVAEFKRASRSFRAWRYGFLLMWLLLPIALALGVSAIKPLFISRYLIVCLPALVLLACAGITRMRSPAAIVMTVVVFVIVAGYQDVKYYAGRHNRDWRSATGYVLSRSQPGDAVVFSPWYLQSSYDYYLTRLSASNGPPVVFDWGALNAAGDPTDELLKTLPAHYSRIWLLYHSDTARTLSPHLLASLAATYRNKQDLDFGGVGITLYTAPQGHARRTSGCALRLRIELPQHGGSVCEHKNRI